MYYEDVDWCTNAKKNKIRLLISFKSKIYHKEQNKITEFSEKIDELNQETDTLLEEIDKWQM